MFLLCHVWIVGGWRLLIRVILLLWCLSHSLHIFYIIHIIHIIQVRVDCLWLHRLWL